MNPILGMRGAVISPHSLASKADLDILHEGGNAIEAAIAIASTLTVVCHCDGCFAVFSNRTLITP